MLVTSGYNFEGYDIVEYKGIISNNVVLGANIIQELSANIADTVGIEKKGLKDKLVVERDNAIKELIKNAESKGANALIGVEVQYEEFLNVLVAVIASGTAVKVEKNAPAVKEEAKSLYVSNYTGKKEPRPYKVSLHTSAKKVYMSTKFHNYSSHKIIAIRLDAEFTDLYGEKITLKDIDYVWNQDFSYELKSSRIPIDLDVSKVNILSDVKILVKKYATTEGVVFGDTNSISSLLTQDELGLLKQKRGNDAVEKYKNDTMYWRCVCGNVNVQSDEKCAFCNRIQADMQSTVKFNFEEMIERMKKKDTALEIKNVLMEYIPEIDPKDRMELLQMLASAIELEKTRGSMKDSILQKINRKYDMC